MKTNRIHKKGGEAMLSKKAGKIHRLSAIEISKGLIVVFFASCSSFIYAQETISASGSNATGSGGTVSYTIGQMVYTTNTGSNGSVSHGVQQPYEISEVTGVDEAKEIVLQCFASPNPATEFIKLKVDVSTKFDIKSMSFHLYDLNGKLIETKKLVESETSIDMSALVPATYFLNVVNEKGTIKSFKIIKN